MIKYVKLGLVILLIGCVSPPIVNYSPLKLSYPATTNKSVDNVWLYMQGDTIPFKYEVVGEAHVPLSSLAYEGRDKDVTEEEAIKALQQEAYKRKVDAVINIYTEQQEKDIPAIGRLGVYSKNTKGFYFGGGKIYVRFVYGTFVVKK